MRTYEFETLDVFTTCRFGGNPLAVFPDARGLSPEEMQSLAAELNLSETTFVLPPEDDRNTARVRIFNRTAEMAFAGHPSIGTAFVLARRSPGTFGSMALEVPAGVVAVDIEDDAGTVRGARLEAPQPLTLGSEVGAAEVAACVGLNACDIVTHTHRPTVASAGNPYVILEVGASALGRCEPDLVAFRTALSRHPTMGGRFSLHVYTRDGTQVRARMFAPLAGTWEDPATGSANAPLAGLILHATGADEIRLLVQQGVEMGRPSLIEATARRGPDGIRTGVAGTCVPVFRGTIGFEGKTP